MIQILSAAFVLGLIFNAAPGAVFAETIRRSMSGGFREALILQLGSLTGDALWAILGLLGIGVLLQSPSLQFPIAIAGSAYLGYLAFKIAFTGAKIAFIHMSKPGLLSGLTLQLINPKAYAVNTTLFSGFAFYPDSFFVETALKLLIANMIWIVLHMVWLYAGVRVNRLELLARTQRLINMLMAICLLAVPVLSVWSLLR